MQLVNLLLLREKFLVTRKAAVFFNQVATILPATLMILLRK